MYFVPSERIAIFVDGASLHATARALAFDVDYRRLLALFRSKASLVRALYYTTLVEDQEFSPLRPLIDWLAYNGFSVVTKPAKTFTDSDGRRRVKGSKAVEIVVDALSLAPHLDHLVLLTGDGEFTALVAGLQQKGKRVSVVSTLATQPPMVADELRRQADQFIDLAMLADQIARTHEAQRAPAHEIGPDAVIDSKPLVVRRTRRAPTATAQDVPRRPQSPPTTAS